MFLANVQSLQVSLLKYFSEKDTFSRDCLITQWLAFIILGTRRYHLSPQITVLVECYYQQLPTSRISMSRTLIQIQFKLKFWSTRKFIV